MLSLLLPLILALLGASLESVRGQVFRSRIERSLVLAEYSFLSEYQAAFLDQYGIFCLDSAYGGNAESEERIRKRLLFYLNQNLCPEKSLFSRGNSLVRGAAADLQVSSFVRLTDGRGLEFYEQAVACEKAQYGADIPGDIIGDLREAEQVYLEGREYEETEEQEKNNLKILLERKNQEEGTVTEDPAEELRQTKKSGILQMTAADPGKLSTKAVSLEAAPSRRTLLKGSGPAGQNPAGIINDRWFDHYILNRYRNACGLLQEEQNPGTWLNYEVEYILEGQDSDQKNLEKTVRKLLLIREGINYAYLLTDAGKQQEALLLAAEICGITQTPELIEALKQVILLSWAYGESLLDVRGLLNGKRTAAVKTAASWKLPLAQVFTVRAHLKEYDARSDSGGLSYADYLGVLLALENREKKCMRALDAAEGNLKNTEWGKGLYLDQCIDSLYVRAEFYAPGVFGPDYQRTAERTFAYEW